MPRWQQSEIPVTPMQPPPDLPPVDSTLGGMSWWPTTESAYATYRVRGRTHCTVDVLLVHSGQWAGPPRVAMFVRRPFPRLTLKDPRVFLLCQDHKLQFVTRDNEVRRRAGKDPLAGGGA